MTILQCKNLKKVYGTGENCVTALNGIDLEVGKGEFVAIVGASGSGKSTLLHILGSVDKPTSGTVTIEGTDLSKLNQAQAAIFRRRKVGLVYQFYNLIPTLTVEKTSSCRWRWTNGNPIPITFKRSLPPSASPES